VGFAKEENASRTLGYLADIDDQSIAADFVQMLV
jgi:hypothetical protein